MKNAFIKFWQKNGIDMALLLTAIAILITIECELWKQQDT